MSFAAKYNYYYSLVSEAPNQEVQNDAAAPDPNAGQQLGGETPAATQATIPPEGYVNIIRLLTKALVMNIPASEIDAILSGQEINQENAFEIQNALQAILNQNEVKSDNIERLQNPNYKKFINSVNEKNFIQKYKVILNAMKKQSPYIS
jgi:hypothetical protein